MREHYDSLEHESINIRDYGCTLDGVLYADATALISADATIRQYFLHAVAAASHSYGLSLNQESGE
eukprot:12168066-Prorocentrum_lima.AAC.1